MTRFVVAVSLVSTIWHAASLSAMGEDRDALPKVGGWVKYHVTNKRDTGDEVVGVVTLRSLSATSTDGVACRWMESEYVSTGENKSHEVRKLLIPEKAIQTSEKPYGEMLKYLQRDNGTPLISVAPERQGWMPVDVLYFPGFLKSAKAVDDPRSVKHQTGTLEIPKAQVGTYRCSLSGKNPEQGNYMETQYRVWLHPDLPVGHAHAKVALSLFSENKKRRSWDLEYSLIEFGDKAQATIVEESAP